VVTTQNGPDVARRTRECDSNAIIFFFHPLLVAQQPLVSQGLFIIVASRSHSDTPHSLGLLWASHYTDAETSTFQHPTLTRDVRAPDVIRTRNPGKRAAADPRLTPRGHWDRHAQQIPMKFTICWKITQCIPMSTTLHDVIFQNTAVFNATSRELQISPKLKILISGKKNPKLMVKKHKQAFNCIITPNSLGNLSRRNINTV
jgi:hypothetical protein